MNTLPPQLPSFGSTSFRASFRTIDLPSHILSSQCQERAHTHGQRNKEVGGASQQGRLPCVLISFAMSLCSFLMLAVCPVEVCFRPFFLLHVLPAFTPVVLPCLSVPLHSRTPFLPSFLPSVMHPTVPPSVKLPFLYAHHLPSVKE